jgi:hypothetical protein
MFFNLLAMKEKQNGRRHLATFPYIGQEMSEHMVVT